MCKKKKKYWFASNATSTCADEGNFIKQFSLLFLVQYSEVKVYPHRCLCIHCKESEQNRHESCDVMSHDWTIVCWFPSNLFSYQTQPNIEENRSRKTPPYIVQPTRYALFFFSVVCRAVFMWFCIASFRLWYYTVDV